MKRYFVVVVALCFGFGGFKTFTSQSEAEALRVACEAAERYGDDSVDVKETWARNKKEAAAACTPSLFAGAFRGIDAARL